MKSFNQNIFILGCGAVVQCTLPLLFKHFAIKPQQVTIMDFVDNRHRVQDFLDKGVTYVQFKITPKNYAQTLAKYLKAGDIFIDLAWNIDTCTMLEWAHNNNVFYINTSVEEWEPYEHIQEAIPHDFTLYHRQMEIKNLAKKWGKGTTAVVDHGANPGLVSHFTKQALVEIASKIMNDNKDTQRVAALKNALDQKKFAQLAYLTGTKVIHISERDSQITCQPKQVNEFLNTWSIEGFMEEGMAPSELGWGTHEKKLPKGAMVHESGPKNQILLSSRGMDTWVRSWVPSGQIIGMVIRHGEAFGISDRLTVYENSKPIYRPTVHYVYCCSDVAFNSLHEFKMRNFVSQDKRRIINDDIICGVDELGCLLMGHDYNTWWIGSILDINESRKLAPHQNSTTLQVAISVIAALMYMLDNPQLGICLPDDLDHEQILKIAKPYLGTFVSKAVDWTPISGPNQFLVFGKNIPKEEDIWQFDSFLVKTDFYKKDQFT